MPIHDIICLRLLLLACCLSTPALAAEIKDGAFHVHPGESIQPALDAAAASDTTKIVRVHAGTYRPERAGQALLWFQRKHDGIRLEAVGEVVLTAANPALSDPRRKGHPAVVNHVVYFGDGVSDRTELVGFRITGANDAYRTNDVAMVEPNDKLEKGLFFYCDGGGIKVFGRAYPVIRGVEVFGNYSSPCAGGVSVEHDGHGGGTAPKPVRFVDCVFRDNTAAVNGAAVDLLPGSHAVLTNCLFLRNAGNLSENYIDPRPQKEFTNAAVLCVFPDARAVVQRCTFTGNRNAVHDLGLDSIYENSLFWDNRMPGGYYTSERYEMHIERRATVRGCRFGGTVIDPNGMIPEGKKVLSTSDPRLDADHVPQADGYEGVGFRPGLGPPH